MKKTDNGLKMSQTHVTPQDVMQLCNKICNIRTAGKNYGIKNINKLDNLMVSSNTPGPAQGTHGKGGLNCDETGYNKLPPGPPIDNPCTPTRHDGSLPLNQTEPSGTPPEPSVSHAPSDAAAKTIKPASTDTAGDPKELPFDEHMASSSPDSLATIKPSSH